MVKGRSTCLSFKRTLFFSFSSTDPQYSFLLYFFFSLFFPEKKRNLFLKSCHFLLFFFQKFGIGWEEKKVPISQILPKFENRVNGNCLSKGSPSASTLVKINYFSGKGILKSISPPQKRKSHLSRIIVQEDQ